MGEFTLNPRDASVWSDSSHYFGSSVGASYQVPYSVVWSCTGGSTYGSCDHIASGTTVTAKGCGGVQECQEVQSD